MNIEEYKGVFVFAQQVDNELSGIALELIGKGKDLAKDLGTEVTAVLVGSDGEPFNPRLESSTSLRSALPQTVISALHASKIPPGVI